jgi:hypothetical protein
MELLIDVSRRNVLDKIFRNTDKKILIGRVEERNECN